MRWFLPPILLVCISSLKALGASSFVLLSYGKIEGSKATEKFIAEVLLSFISQKITRPPLCFSKPMTTSTTTLFKSNRLLLQEQIIFTILLTAGQKRWVKQIPWETCFEGEGKKSRSRHLD